MNISVGNMATYRKKDGAIGIYVGRTPAGQPIRFGNQYVVGVDGDAAECVAKHRAWMQRHPGAVILLWDHIIKQLGPAAHSKETSAEIVLLCWCKPGAPCHAQNWKDALLGELEAMP